MKIQPRFQPAGSGRTVKLPTTISAQQREEKRLMETRIEASLSGTKVETKKEAKPQAAPPSSWFGTPPVTIEAAAALCGGDLEALRRDGLPETVDLEKLEQELTEITGHDFMKSTADIGQALEELASRFAVVKARIEKEPEDGEKGGRLQALTDLMERQTQRLAENFADSIGGFYEKHGLDGERDKMYQSVLENARSLYKEYDAFAKRGNYGNVPAEDAWLRNCDEYMASELRSAYVQTGVLSMPSLNRDMIPMQSLSAASDLAKAASRCIDGGAAGTASEEELGVRLGTMALTGYRLAESSKALQYHKQAILDAFGTRMETLLDESDRLLSKKAETGGKEAYPPLDRAAVASIAETMIGTYRVTGSVDRGLQAGIAKAHKRYLEKKDPHGAVERYRRSGYWEQMLVMKTTGYSGKTGAQGILRGLRASLPADVSLDSVFGTNLLGKA